MWVSNNGGINWAQFAPPDPTFNGSYESFTVNYLNNYGYAVSGLAVVPGDANLDRKVDINDLTLVLTNFGQTTGMTWATGDFNNDGKVDINDLTTVLTNFGQSAHASLADGIKAVPEPTSLLLLAAVGLTGLLTFAWRKRK